jgi:hypothetical protein
LQQPFLQEWEPCFGKVRRLLLLLLLVAVEAAVPVAVEAVHYFQVPPVHFAELFALVSANWINQDLKTQANKLQATLPLLQNELT